MEFLENKWRGFNKVQYREQSQFRGEEATCKKTMSDQICSKNY